MLEMKTKQLINVILNYNAILYFEVGVNNR